MCKCGFEVLKVGFKHCALGLPYKYGILTCTWIRFLNRKKICYFNVTSAYEFVPVTDVCLQLHVPTIFLSIVVTFGPINGTYAANIRNQITRLAGSRSVVDCASNHMLGWNSCQICYPHEKSYYYYYYYSGFNQRDLSHVEPQSGYISSMETTTETNPCSELLVSSVSLSFLQLCRWCR